MAQYFYNCSFLTIPRYYLSATIGEYAQSNFIEETDSFFNKQENPVFFYKNHRLKNVIDDDITWAVLDAIHNTNAIQYKYRTKGGFLKECTLISRKIIHRLSLIDLVNPHKYWIYLHFSLYITVYKWYNKTINYTQESE